MPAVIIFLIIMFVALIVFEWGDARRGRGAVRHDDAAAGEINGEQISLALYQKRVQDITDMQRQANPNGEVDDDRIREGVWQQLVDETLIRQAADHLGLFVSDDELRETLLYDPPPSLKQPFTDSSGVFHQTEFFQFMTDTRGFLSQRKMKPEEIQKIEDQILSIQDGLRSQKLREAVTAVVTASAIPSPAEARAAFDEQRGKATGTFAVLDVNSIADASVNVTEAEAKKYYDDHKADFQQKASREIRYAMFQLTPSGQDSNAMNKRLKSVTDALAKAATPAAKDSIFEGFVNQYGSGKFPGTAYTPMQEISPDLQNALKGAEPGSVIGPTRLADGSYLINVIDIKDSGEAYVKASHILLRTGTKNDDSVKALADKIFQRAKSGENFETLAQQFSADGSAQRGGDLGFFKKGAMVKPFEDAAFAAPVGSIVGPVKSEFGWHIIKVTDRTSKAYKLRDLRFDPKISNMTKTQLRAKAQQFREKVLAGGTPMDTLGSQQKVQVLESGPLDRATPAGGSLQLTNFAYEGKVGDVSEVIDLKEGGMVVGQISKVHTAGTMDFADAKEGIMAKLKTKKKLDMLKDRATKIRAALGPNDSLGALTKIDSSVQIRAFNDATRSTPFPGVGFDYVLTNAVFNQKIGQVSELIRGERGYYIVEVASRTVPSDKEFETERTKFVQQFTEQRRQTMFQDWLQKEREHSDIQDFRTGNH